MELPKPRKRKGKPKKLETKTSKDASVSLFVKLKIHWWISGLLFTGLLSWAVMPIVIQWNSGDIEDFSIGEKSSYSVISPGSTSYNDVDATRREKERVKLNVPLAFDLKKRERLQDAKALFSGIRSIRNETIPVEDKIAKMGSNLIVDFLSEKTRIKLATVTDEKIDEIEKNVIDILDKILSNGVVRGGGTGIFAEEISTKMPRGDNWRKIYERLTQEKGYPPTDSEVATEMEIELLPSSKKVKVKELYSWLEAKNIASAQAASLANSEVVSEICRALIRPNVFYNEEVTNQKRQEAASSITETNVIKKGEKIISQGEEITQTHLEKLKAIKPLQKAAFVRMAIGTGAMVLFLLSLLLLYLRKYEPQIFSEYRKLVALSITILLSVIAEKLLIIYGIHGLGLPYPILLIPAAITSAMVAILISPQLAILVTITICIFIGIMSGFNIEEELFERLTLVFCVGMVAIFSLSPNIRRRRDMMVGGLYVCLTSPIIVASVSLAQNGLSSDLTMNSIVGIISGVIVVILVPGLLPVFEYLMKTTTDIQLLELSDRNHPLLKELEEKAPGTYHHSMNVSSLAEAAAEDINANALLARVGAYYHDIGKMERPEYFYENQKNGKNIHDTLGPQFSAKLIKDHVECGIKMAKKYKLPKVIEDMIPQHHGTTLVLYFYKKAQETEKHDTVEEDNFRYAGPKPQTKEAAIMLLADSVEAAARSMMLSKKENPTYKELRELVQRIVNMKISDFQLDESNLTLTDLSIIVNSFLRVLEGMYHSRVAYPSGDKKEVNGESIEIKAAPASSQ